MRDAFPGSSQWPLSRPLPSPLRGQCRSPTGFPILRCLQRHLAMSDNHAARTGRFRIRHPFPRARPLGITPADRAARWDKMSAKLHLNVSHRTIQRRLRDAQDHPRGGADREQSQRPAPKASSIRRTVCAITETNQRARRDQALDPTSSQSITDLYRVERGVWATSPRKRRHRRRGRAAPDRRPKDDRRYGCGTRSCHAGRGSRTAGRVVELDLEHRVTDPKTLGDLMRQVSERGVAGMALRRDEMDRERRAGRS